MTISADQRTALARAVAGLRRVLQEDYAALAEGKFGIHLAGRRAGEIEDSAALSLSSHDLAARAELVGVIDYLRGEGLSEREAVERMVREAVFTTVNRLLAIRVAEAIGVLPPSVAEGSGSEGFAEAVEVFPLLRDADDSDGYWTYLQICGDELSHAVPRLFDRRHPLSALVPSAEALEEAVGILANPELADAWVEPEALGWSYQFFNSDDEIDKAREGSPRTSRDLAIRNQFFTPGYVVSFLVDNTLGRRLLEGGYDVEVPLLEGEVDRGSRPIELANITVLDPAVGSGHFLLGAYDILEQAWARQGVDPGDAAPRILGSLFGIEIDPRAAQVAQAVLYLRARRSSGSRRLEPPTVVTARSMPREPETRATVLRESDPRVSEMVDRLQETLRHAPLLGSLLRPEAELESWIHDRASTPRLGDDASLSYQTLEREVLDAAYQIARRAAASPEERLFAADATDALTFVEVCIRRYDAVLMNPPFGEPVASTKAYLADSYPEGKFDIYAAFVSRCLSLLKPDGYAGQITNRTGFFQTTGLKWRTSSVIPHLVTMIDLGFPVMHGALVESAAYVLARAPTRPEATVRRLLKEQDKAAAALDRDRGDRFVISRASIGQVPGSPLAYWVDEGLAACFEAFPPLHESVALVQGGLQGTKDDFRFVRLWWEVDPRSLGDRWWAYAKGGEYSPWYANVHLVVDWEDSGRRIEESVLEKYPYLGDNAEWVLHRSDALGSPGLTWGERTASSSSFWVLPGASIFSATGPGVVPLDPADSGRLLAFLNSRFAEYLIGLMVAAGEETSSGTAARHYTVGIIRSLPAPTGLSIEAGEAALDVAEWFRKRSQTDECDRHFSDFRGQAGSTGYPWASVARIEGEVSKAFGLSELAQAQLDEEMGPVPTDYTKDLTSARMDPSELARLKIGELIDIGLRSLGGRRFIATKSSFLNRQIEIIAHLCQLHPEAVEQILYGSSSHPGSDPDLDQSVSLGLGIALGRWDVRIMSGELSPPGMKPWYEPLPQCPPATLLGLNGMPAVDAPDGYPLDLPPDRILVDERGHERDVVALVEAAVTLLVAEREDASNHMHRLEAGPDLRSHMRDRFFAKHLGQYSMSRRKAPIYWYLAVPSREWGLWVYAPWLSREQLFAIARAAQEKLRRLRDQAGQLRRDLEAGSGREIRDRLEATEDLIREVEVFHEKAEAVAQSGWEPDLNDGIILNAAPLEDLFADAKWRNDIAKHREKMEDGEYPWATVQRQYFDRLRP